MKYHILSVSRVTVQAQSQPYPPVVQHQLTLAMDSQKFLWVLMNTTASCNTEETDFSVFMTSMQT